MRFGAVKNDGTFLNGESQSHSAGVPCILGVNNTEAFGVFTPGDQLDFNKGLERGCAEATLRSWLSDVLQSVVLLVVLEWVTVKNKINVVKNIIFS